jgi:HK97 family phage major capsid protein
MSTTRLLEYIEKASFTTGDLQGGANGGYLAHEQAKTFLRDAVEETVIVQGSDVFDSANPIFEVPKLSFSSRILGSGTEGVRGAQTKPATGLVTLTTQLFKGEVAMSDETFEDNVERGGLADTIAQQIAQAVGRDIEELSIKSKSGSASADFAKLGDGLVLQLINSTTMAAGQKIDASTSNGGVAETSYKALFKKMVAALPARYRSRISNLVLYTSIAVSDGYADGLSQRGTQLGDENLVNKTKPRYRGITIEEVAMLNGTNGTDAFDFSKVCILCDPKNLKTGFHRRVRLEKWREPREGQTYFLPTVRWDVKWSQDTAVVIAQNVPQTLS